MKGKYKMKLSELIKNVKCKNIISEHLNPEITGVRYNSNKVEKGNLFVAVKGYKTDGHKYIKSAVENGAAAVICEERQDDLAVPQIIVENSRIAEAVVSAEMFSNPSKKLKLIGITGTNGKTTCTYLVKQILESNGYKCGLIGTNQNMIGDTVLETGRTTPDSYELQELFAKMSSQNCDYVIMEVSSHALELDRVYGCEFEVGAFTNLTQDHLDFHKTMDNYAKAKSKLFSMSKKSVINADDKYADVMIKGASDYITYGINENADIKAENIEYSARGVAFNADNTNYYLGIPGSFSVYNALCAIAIAKSVGIDDENAAKALKCAHGVKGRAEIVPTDTDYTVMIDYAHTPDGLENILNTVRGFAKGRVVVVFGCGGDRDNTKRPIMGEIASKLADFAVVTSDNPRSENPMKIIEMIEQGIKTNKTPYVIIENRKEAIKYALENAQKDDVIVLAGKGHETYQILAEGTIHFDEREAVRDILNKNN